MGSNSFSPITFGYTYDKLGNITKYSQTGKQDVTYEYDQQGQLTGVSDPQRDLYYAYTYDTVGNIRSVDAHGSYHTSDDYTNTYTYGNAKWLDLLTAFNGEKIAYEGQTFNATTGTVTGTPTSGNPISYFNGTRWSFDWRNGRELSTATATDPTGLIDTAITYEYDVNGLRIGKTVTTDTYENVFVHKYIATVVNPTCTEAGYTLHQCACGDSYQDTVVDALGHNYTSSTTEDGIVYTCTRCGDSYAEHIHSYTVIVVAPTCTAKGYTLHSCACGHSYQDGEVAALGHDYEESTTEEGIVYTCIRCNDSYTGHTHSYTITVVEPTCTEEGYTLRTCSCGYSYQSSMVEALGHNYEASNTEVGTVYTCTRCDDSYMDHTHSYTNTVVEPTCTAGGYTLHSCDCGYSYQDAQTDALGHNYTGSNTQVGTIYTCTRCNDSYTGHTHSYTETVIAATCITEGYTIHSCACGYNYQSNTVAALGHNYQETTEGNDTTYTCTRCGDTYTEHTHSYTTTVVEPTCTMQGYTLYTCACGHSYQDNVVAALGHDYEVIDEDELTCTHRCTRCGHTYTSNKAIVPIIPVDPNPPVVASYGLRNASAPSEDCGGTERTLVSTTTESHEYIYAGSNLLRETITTTDEDGNVSTQTLDLTYDANGSPYTLTHTSGTTATTYYYITNPQGDVIRLVDTTGATAAQYSYDPWGKQLSIHGASINTTIPSTHIAHLNPLRYRGYYYDAETSFYYLQSRYYDPSICRFINADALMYAGVGFIGYNMFAYCSNNPVNCADPSGYAPGGGNIVLFCDGGSGSALEYRINQALSIGWSADVTKEKITINLDEEIESINFILANSDLSLELISSYIAEAACDKYYEMFGEEFLLSDECVANEIYEHIVAYKWSIGEKFLPNAIAAVFSAYNSREDVYNATRLTDIRLTDITDVFQGNENRYSGFYQVLVFGYCFGVRDIYIGTEKDPWRDMRHWR